MKAQLVVVSVLTAAAVVFVVMRNRAKLCCRQLIATLRPGQLAGLWSLIDTESDVDALYDRSHRATGVYRRWRNRVPLVRMCQLLSETSFMQPDELEEMLQKAAMLTRLTFAAAVWVSLRRYTPDRAANALRAQLVLYRELAEKTHGYLACSGEHLCAEKLAEVL